MSCPQTQFEKWAIRVAQGCNAFPRQHLAFGPLARLALGATSFAQGLRFPVQGLEGFPPSGMVAIKSIIANK